MRSPAAGGQVLTDGEGQRIERMLTPLIRTHGLARVRRDLTRLLPEAEWQLWQRVWNIAENINNRLQRKMKG